MKTVAGLEVLTSSGRNESAAPCQLRTALERKNGEVVLPIAIYPLPFPGRTPAWC